MSHYRAELARQLEEQEAGVADLVAAYEAAEVAYFAAVAVSAPITYSFITANSSGRVSDANMK